MKKIISLLLLVQFLSACGPIYGQLMRLSEGIKTYQPISGQLRLPPGSRLLIVAPFAKRAKASFICRNDDPVAFAEHFTARGFKADLTFIQNPAEQAANEARLRSLSAAALQAELQLAAPPDFLLFGTLLKRETTVAPLRGVVMEQAFRLEFLDLSSRQTTVIEVAARTLAQDSIGAIVDELVLRSR